MHDIACNSLCACATELCFTGAGSRSFIISYLVSVVVCIRYTCHRCMCCAHVQCDVYNVCTSCIIFFLSHYRLSPRGGRYYSFNVSLFLWYIGACSVSSFKFSTRTCSQSLLSVVLSIITRSESTCGRASSLGYLSTGFGPRAHREPFCHTLRTGCDETVDWSISTNVRDEDSFNCSAESN